jgi:hypothetical protein
VAASTDQVEVSGTVFIDVAVQAHGSSPPRVGEDSIGKCQNSSRKGDLWGGIHTVGARPREEFFVLKNPPRDLRRPHARDRQQLFTERPAPPRIGVDVARL